VKGLFTLERIMTMIKEWVELISALEQEKIRPEATIEERDFGDIDAVGK
jgi:hypothetical protein